MRLEEVTTTVFRTAWNLPPNRLGRFLVSTVVPGAYAQGVRRLHEQAQRIDDLNTLQVLASVALWARGQESSACGDEALFVLKVFSEQSDADLADVLNPHAAAVAKVLLDRDAGLVQQRAQRLAVQPGAAGPAVDVHADRDVAVPTLG